MELLTEILRAESRIRGMVRETPLERSPVLSRAAGSEVFLKLENLQFTGSFKVRGAFNRMLALGDEGGARGVVAASTGNHGAAVAFAAARLKVASTVFVPDNAASVKVEAMKRLGAEVRVSGNDCVVAEFAAREYAAENGCAYISPYNDLEVVAGQGTIGMEISRAIEGVDRLFVSLGGGGLIAGIACYLKALHPKVRVIGCSPENSCVMVESLRAGRILQLESKETLSDGTAGGVEPGAVTFDLCRSLVDECILVTEEEIASAMRSFMETHHQLIEGAAAVSLAALSKASEAGGGKDVVVLCGANASLATLRSIL